MRCAAASAVGQMGAEGADQCGALLGMLQDYIYILYIYIYIYTDIR